jgi:hypothetical protein
MTSASGQTAQCLAKPSLYRRLLNTAHAVLHSRVRALIWAMRTGPSENSSAPVFRVNSRK